MQLFLIPLIIIIFGLLLLVRERRSFIGGMSFAFGGLLLSIGLLFLGLFKLS